MKKDDVVISTGDYWVPEGSEGVVLENNGAGSVLVRWDKIGKIKSDDSEKAKLVKPGTLLFHVPITLIPAKGSRNPNTQFKIKKRMAQ